MEHDCLEIRLAPVVLRILVARQLGLDADDVFAGRPAILPAPRQLDLVARGEEADRLRVTPDDVAVQQRLRADGEAGLVLGAVVADSAAELDCRVLVALRRDVQQPRADVVRRRGGEEPVEHPLDDIGALALVVEESEGEGAQHQLVVAFVAQRQVVP